MNVLELVIAVVMLALIVDGARIGMVKTLFSIVRMAIGIVLAAIVCSAITGMIPQRMSYLVPVAFITIIGVVLGILGAVERLLNLVDKIPIARQLNKIAGIPAGLIKAVITLWIFLIIIGYFSDTQWGQTLLNMVNESPRLTFAGNCNPIQSIILHFTSVFLPNVTSQV